MPKVKASDLTSRIIKRIEELDRGEEVPAKDIRAVLTLDQQEQLETAWAEQQALRRSHGRANDAEKQLLGWKTKREVNLDVLRNALEQAKANILAAIEEEQRQSEVRAARIYLDAIIAAAKIGITGEQAADMANNALTRAGFNRFDRKVKDSKQYYVREIHAIEEELREHLGISLTPLEREFIGEPLNKLKRRGTKK